MAELTALKNNMLTDSEFGVSGPAVPPAPAVQAEAPQEEKGIMNLWGLLSGKAPDPQTAQQPDGKVDTTVQPPKPMDVQQAADAVSKDPVKAEGAKTAFVAMTDTLPAGMKKELQEEYAALERKRDETRNHLAWVEGISMLAQFGLKMVAASKSIHEGIDYTSGVQIPMNQFSGAYKSLQDDFESGKKDIQLRTEMAFRGQQSKEEQAGRAQESLLDRQSRERMAGKEIRSREDTARSERIQRMTEMGDKNAYDSKLLDLKEMEAGGKGPAKLTPEQYTDKMLTIKTLEEKANSIVDNPASTGWIWLDDDAEQRKFFSDIGVSLGSGQISRMNPKEKADLKQRVAQAMSSKKSLISQFKPGEPSAPVATGQSTAASQGGYEVGKKYRGKEYLGGNPNDPKSWR